MLSENSSVVAADSPYVGLVDLCYQLRFENELLTKTVSLKSDEIAACNAQLALFKSVHQTADLIPPEQYSDISSERLAYMQKSFELESQLRSCESKCARLEAEIYLSKNEIQVAPVEQTFPAVADDKFFQENQRLLAEIKTFEYIQKQLERKLEARLDEEEREAKKPKLESVLTISGDDSLLRTYESIMGWNIVSEENGLIRLIPKDTGCVVRLSGSDILDNPEYDPDAVAILKLTKSLPAFMAKCILNNTLRSIY